MSIRKTAEIFACRKSLVKKLVKQQKIEGNSQPKPRGEPRYIYLNNVSGELREIVAAHPDAALVELCELFAKKIGNWVLEFRLRQKKEVHYCKLNALKNHRSQTSD